MEAPNRTVGDDLSPLWVPVPRNLAEVLGYDGDARYVAYYWNNAVDELAYDDGHRHGVGESLRFLQYVGHPSVEPEVGWIDIGLLDQDAAFWLILDRQCNNLYYASPAAARSFLAEQHPDDDTTIADQRMEVTESIAGVLRDEGEHGHDSELDEMLSTLDAWTHPSPFRREED